MRSRSLRRSADILRRNIANLSDQEVRMMTGDYRPTEPLPGKGDTRCNRTACQIEIKVGERFWNTVTQAFYCPGCAQRINLSSPGMCIPESEKP